MGNDYVTVAVVITHFLVTGGYIGLGIFLAPKFDAAAPTRILQSFKAAGLTFFLACAYSHAHWGVHIWDGSIPRSVWDSPHYIFHMVLQAAAALAALVLAFRFISVRVYDKGFYAGFLDRVIDVEAQKIARSIRREDVYDVERDVKRVADAAERIKTAMGR